MDTSTDKGMIVLFRGIVAKHFLDNCASMVELICAISGKPVNDYVNTIIKPMGMQGQDSIVYYLPRILGVNIRTIILTNQSIASVFYPNDDLTP